MDCINDRNVTPRETSGAEGSWQTEPPLLSRDSALYLDFDGTLVDLAPTPDSVRPAEGLVELLGSLQQLLAGAVAIVTGRRLESVDRWLAPLRFCGAGLHGAQMRLARDQADTSEFPPEIGRLAAELRAIYANDPRILVEDKGGTVALHYRLAPERAPECAALMRRLALAHGLDVITGHAVVEARPRGVNKGLGVHRLAEAAPFAGRSPVFVGDDTTDEDAILVAQALAGIGIRVGATHSAARYRLADVAAVHRWLRASVDHLQSRP
ncbi:MAG: otsB [Hydrocarboniphaga sp.]|uniref:trehalose-phosphatase n=1 Tax=Hydrocarboniphaga sp. TaxID=2033016 RepID=UPI0026233BEE|nr:trehalose-phosphatase [Hydrocarboniphaga sp.]MDB5969114.1 otsB [Hydrocarboniphaga sp.]